MPENVYLIFLQGEALNCLFFQTKYPELEDIQIVITEHD